MGVLKFLSYYSVNDIDVPNAILVPEVPAPFRFWISANTETPPPSDRAILPSIRVELPTPVVSPTVTPTGTPLPTAVYTPTPTPMTYPTITPRPTDEPPPVIATSTPFPTSTP